MNLTKNAHIFQLTYNMAFLAIINFMLVLTFGYLTLNQNATFESRMAAIALAFFIPMFIVSKTQHITGWARSLKYGSGLILYLFVAHISLGIEIPVVDMLSPVLILALVTLGFGNVLLRSK